MHFSDITKARAVVHRNHMLQIKQLFPLLRSQRSHWRPLKPYRDGDTGHQLALEDEASKLLLTRPLLVKAQISHCSRLTLKSWKVPAENHCIFSMFPLAKKLLLNFTLGSLYCKTKTSIFFSLYNAKCFCIVKYAFFFSQLHVTPWLGVTYVGRSHLLDNHCSKK